MCRPTDKPPVVLNARNIGLLQLQESVMVVAAACFRAKEAVLESSARAENDNSKNRSACCSGANLTEKGFKRTMVEHRYHDYAVASSSSTSSSEKLQCVSHFVNSNSFPCILHYMLEQAQSQGYSHIVDWQPHGRCWLIKDQRAFISQVIPIYWPKQHHFSSFQRQLALYGFLRLTRRNSPDFGACKLSIRNALVICGKVAHFWPMVYHFF
jgi:hypothetical protein